MEKNWIIDREYLEDEFGIFDEETQTKILKEIAEMDCSMLEKHFYIEENY